MRKKCRSLVVREAETKMVSLFAYTQHSGAWREWSFRTVSLAKAERKQRAGEAAAVIRMVDGEVRVIGYQETRPARLSRPSQTTLTMATTNAVAKAALGGELNSAEAKHVAKFLLWPFEHDRRNPSTVGPRVGELELARARAAISGSLGRRAA